VSYGAENMRAKQFIPCVNNNCHVIRDDGTERRSRMQLVVRENGQMVPKPYYLCERRNGVTPCEYSTRPLYACDINMDRWVRESHRADSFKPKDGDKPTAEHLETMI
jgi:hypothetical protein